MLTTNLKIYWRTINQHFSFWFFFKDLWGKWAKLKFSIGLKPSLRLPSSLSTCAQRTWGGDEAGTASIGSVLAPCLGSLQMDATVLYCAGICRPIITMISLWSQTSLVMPELWHLWTQLMIDSRRFCIFSSDVQVNIPFLLASVRVKVTQKGRKPPVPVKQQDQPPTLTLIGWLPLGST